MKVLPPKEFVVWYEKYTHTANYFMALDDVNTNQSSDQQHALWLCMRDAFIAGSEAGPEPTEEKK